MQPPPTNSSRQRDLRLSTWRYLRALGAGADEADDLVQEVMLVALGGVPDDPDRAAAFLRGVARNHWLRSRRWWRRRREREIAAAVDELWMATAADDDGHGLLTRLDACLDKLERRARNALERHYRDGVAWDEVAVELGLRPNGIKTLAQRARQALRTCIERSDA
ncbi:MAG: sigma-70 family RNA polymerase sigma factor [Planctomycetes bacterium]|nr:sigma-70 family RNA polymerase sigma factor [Planctomycetota bacterium]